MRILPIGSRFRVVATVCLSESLLSQTEKEPKSGPKTIFKSVAEYCGEEIVVFFISKGYGAGSVVQLKHGLDHPILFPSSYNVVHHVPITHDTAFCDYLLSELKDGSNLNEK